MSHLCTDLLPTQSLRRPTFDAQLPNPFPARLPALFLAKDFGPAHVSENETTFAAALWHYTEGQPQHLTYPHQSLWRLASTHVASHWHYSYLVVVQTYHQGPPSPHHQLPHFTSFSAPLQPQITYAWSHPVGHLGHPRTSSVVVLSFPALTPTPAYAPSVDPDHQHFTAYSARLAADWSRETQFTQISLLPQQSMLTMHLSPLSKLHPLSLHLVLSYPCLLPPLQDFPSSHHQPSCPTDNHWSHNNLEYVTNTTSLLLTSKPVSRQYWLSSLLLAVQSRLVTHRSPAWCFPSAVNHSSLPYKTKSPVTSATSSPNLSNMNSFHNHCKLINTTLLSATPMDRSDLSYVWQLSLARSHSAIPNNCRSMGTHWVLVPMSQEAKWWLLDSANPGWTESPTAIHNGHLLWQLLAPLASSSQNT